MRLNAEALALFIHDHHRPKLICPNLIEADSGAHPQRCPKFNRPPQQRSCFGRLRGVEPVQRVVIATAAVWRVVAEPRIAEIVAPQRPVNEESQGELFGPLPACQFGSAVSWNEASKASMAAFTATAWWMIGTSPAYPSALCTSLLYKDAAGAKLMINSCRL